MIALRKILIILCIFVSSIQARSVFIIVHGTWGAESPWYVPKGDFFDALEQTASKKNSSVVSFRWSGGAGHEARVQAARSLVKFIKTYDTTVVIYVVGHSHGGNVASLASQMLAQEENNEHYIHALFTLGTPIMSNYLPHMDTIHYVYNLFSFEDLIQTVLGVSGREYPEHERIANLRVFIDGKEPKHTDLHHAVIGKWLPYVHHQFTQYLRENGITDRISEPSVVLFYSDKAPKYMFDLNRTAALERDRQISVLLLNSLRDFSSVRPDASINSAVNTSP